jgi:integrase
MDKLLYRPMVRLHLKPGLGKQTLKRLSVQNVQAFLNRQLQDGRSIRHVHIMRQILRSALARAMREELVARIVAQLVELPGWEPAIITPWSSAEAIAFLQAATGDQLAAAFFLLVLYGMRRGEVLGLRWQDRDFDAKLIRIRQQVQRVNGELHIGPVKTKAGNRDLPRDAQIILEHANFSTTQQIYTHVDEAARLEALTRLNKLLGGM